MAYRFTPMTIEPDDEMHNLKIIFISLAIVFIGFFGSMREAGALDINTLRFGQHGDSIRVVLELSTEADFRAMAQGSPAQILLDVPALSGQPVIQRASLPDLIKDIRLEPLGNSHSRLTFVLDQPAAIRNAFLMPAGEGMPVRLVLDLARTTQAAFDRQIGRSFGTLTIASDAKDLPFAGISGPRLDTARLEAISKPKAPEVAGVEVADVKSPDAPQTLPLVVIDAGHGGIDGGASGSGLLEKDVTLAMARDLRRTLETTGKYRVALTRDSDKFIRLEERVHIARRLKADLFVSIHADSSEGMTRAKGASFYTLSNRASDHETAALAARENRADLLAGVELPTDDKELAGIMIDLTTRETVRESRGLATQLVNAFTKNQLNMPNGPKRSAGFMVLKAPDIPSVLIETGFLSNPEEVKKLADNRYRESLSAGIAQGIDAWFKLRKTP